MMVHWHSGQPSLDSPSTQLYLVTKHDFSSIGSSIFYIGYVEYVEYYGKSLIEVDAIEGSDLKLS
jgi:hypothetical protein